MKNIVIKFVSKQDTQFLLENTDLTSELFNRKLKYKEILIAEVDEKPVGLLIYEYLWSHIPFISFIWVDTKDRKIGIGKALLSNLEMFLIKRGNDVLFSSSEENAIEAQAWHRHMGFIDCGTISEINDDNTAEVFFRKSLKRDV